MNDIPYNIPDASPKNYADSDMRAGENTRSQPPACHYADPTAMGLLSFAMSAVILGLYHCGVGLPNLNPAAGVGPDQAAFGMCLLMGGLVEFIGGILHFWHGNTLLMNTHTIFAGFWSSYSMFMIHDLDLQGNFYKDDNHAWTYQIGVYLLAWSFISWMFMAASLKTSPPTVAIFFTLALTFLFLSIANFISTHNALASLRLNKAGGAMCVVCGMISFYAGGAGIMKPETTFVRFPQGRL
ncbi:methylglyoxal reductase (NADPH-dependent) gre2 [Ascosphaera pollenicola]|nr:methylglyoxal reductase (NADPH-dependent) gre2 [Ascosphaera pollenicola]